MDEEIQSIHTTLQEKLSSVTSLADLEAISTEYLGRKGHVNGLFAKFKDFSREEVKVAGQKINTLKGEVEKALADRREELAESSADAAWTDTTLPGVRQPRGSLHIVTHTIR